MTSNNFHFIFYGGSHCYKIFILICLVAEAIYLDLVSDSAAPIYKIYKDLCVENENHEIFILINYHHYEAY